MKKYDKASSLFWLLLSILVCIESLSLGIGTLRKPGTGFMSFGTAGLLGILSIALLLQTIFRRGETEVYVIFSGTLWKRALFVLASLVIYSRLMPLAGYLISTFLLMSFLFWIVRGQRWWWVFISSFLTTVITYYVFSVWLNCQFPEGILGL